MLIDGPRQPPVRGGKPDSLIVFLHGYGSNGADLMSLAPYWAKVLPGAQFLAPNGPEPVPMAPGGYQWFPISSADPHMMAQGAARAAGVLDRYLDREIARYQLPASKVALVGFSQGTMMALQVGLRRAEGLGAILGFSGALPGADRLKDEMKSKPPIFLIHGSEDDMIPVGMVLAASQGLAAAGHAAQWRISYGVPHSIGPDGLEFGGQFLKSALSARAVISG